jgi:catechol 2,3-dioxygenase-like lactoylglutathione lyase family enzyme
MEKGTLLPVSQGAQLRHLFGGLPLWTKSVEKEKGFHMKILKLDHFVLTVRDIEKTISFYTSVMGMKKEEFGQGRVALKYGDQKINLHELGNEFEPKASNPMPGSADLCFITKTPLNEAISHVKGFGVEIVEGPVKRTGARGSILSFYFRDPDNNLIEVANEV